MTTLDWNRALRAWASHRAAELGSWATLAEHGRGRLARLCRQTAEHAGRIADSPWGPGGGAADRQDSGELLASLRVSDHPARNGDTTELLRPALAYTFVFDHVKSISGEVLEAWGDDPERGRLLAALLQEEGEIAAEWARYLGSLAREGRAQEIARVTREWTADLPANVFRELAEG